jgi:predicted nucleotide-binding protein
VFEYGLFVGLLGRERVCCLAKDGDIELPSDLAGVLQIRYTNSPNDVGVRIIDELRAAGYDVTL